MAMVNDAIEGGGLYEGDFALATTPTFAFVASAAMLF
jgi:hypothetical protein